MKILNIFDIEFLQVYLSKYYITNGIQYNFLQPETGNNESVTDSIKEFMPELILIQDNYTKMTGMDIVRIIRKEGIDVKIGYLWLDTKDIFLLQNAAEMNKLGNIHVIIGRGEEVLHFINEFIIKINKNVTIESIIKKENYKILYVDDSPFMHETVKGFFKDTIFNIYSAYDGIQGYELYEKINPDMVITDVEMPKMNGLELCKTIKENNNFERYIPVIILSSHGSEKDVENGFKYGADDYLLKPVKQDVLLSKMNEYVESIERKKSNKVLVIDDSKTVSELVRHTLIKNGINTITASNGVDGYKTALAESPEIIITDIEMPGVNGIGLIKTLRDSDIFNDVKIIAMTESEKTLIIKKLEKLNVAKIFEKPFDVEKLVMLIDRILVEKYDMFKKEAEYMITSIKLLIKALEARDKYTKGHTERVSEYAVKLAKYMKLEKKEIEEIELGASLHDIGKIGIKDNILLKEEQLTEQEYAMIQQHAVIGAEILMPMKMLKGIIPIVLFHHERWDGKGYPSMIKGEKIPLGARIIAVTDTYDAMTTNRPYRKKLHPSEALKIIEDNAGKQFCPRISKAFIEMMKENLVN